MLNNQQTELLVNDLNGGWAAFGIVAALLGVSTFGAGAAIVAGLLGLGAWYVNQENIIGGNKGVIILYEPPTYVAVSPQ